MAVHLDTLEEMRGPNDERVERDITFTTRPLEECEHESRVLVVGAEETL